MPQNQEYKPTIAITVGDPAGIGPEVVLKALADTSLHPLAHWIVVSDSAVMRQAEAMTGLRLEGAELHDAHSLGGTEVPTGKLDARCGAAAVDYVRTATELCLARKADAMVTAPLNKEAVTLSGRPFTGHTEYIAELCGATESRMLLASDKLATIHVSTHMPLRRACDLNTARIVRTIELGNEAVKLLGHSRPRVAVCGLNPHAGEHGLFGEEDERFIVPAIAEARAQGIECSGPHAGDTVFLQASRGAYDLVVAMYHDQGHIPMKLIDFEGTVNISLGIPIIRTSVDHGTAFDIAGKNQADARSMKQAMRIAARMAATRLAMEARSPGKQ